jgi:uncharacterized spore protein YtfJ
MVEKMTLAESSEENNEGFPGIAANMIESTLEKHISIADVSSVYGKPIKEGDKVIIPAAEVLAFTAFGVGGGIAPTTPEDDPSGKPTIASGGGGGGGGRVFARPAAVIIVSPEGVRVEPVIDITKIALAAFTTAGFMAAMVARMLAPRRRFPM